MPLHHLNKIKEDRRNQKNSNKYIHPKNNITTDTPSTTKIKNRKLNQKNNTNKFIPTSAQK